MAPTWPILFVFVFVRALRDDDTLGSANTMYRFRYFYQRTPFIKQSCLKFEWYRIVCNLFNGKLVSTSSIGPLLKTFQRINGSDWHNNKLACFLDHICFKLFVHPRNQSWAKKLMHFSSLKKAESCSSLCALDKMKSNGILLLLNGSAFRHFYQIHYSVF